MKTVSTATRIVHKVRILEEQYSIQSSTFEPMMSIGQWRLKHTSMPQQPDHFCDNRQLKTTKLYNLTTMPWVQRSLYLNEMTNNFGNIQVEVQKGVDGRTGDVLEQCMTTCGKAAGIKAKGKSRAQKEASAEDVRGYYKQFAEAKHLEYKSWIDNEVFDLIDLRKVKPRNYETGSWVLFIKTDNQGNNFSRQRHDGYWDVSKTNGRNISRRILLLPQDLDLEWVPKWQPAKVGTFFTLILRQLSFKDSLMVWIVMLCVENTRSRSSSFYSCKIEETCLWHEWCHSTIVELSGQGTL